VKAPENCHDLCRPAGWGCDLRGCKHPIEAGKLFGWPAQGIANRLRRHPAEVQKLSQYRQAIDDLSQIGLKILDGTGRLVSLAADVSGQFGLLSNDALIVSTMRDLGLTNLASNDADFDRVPGLTRYASA
jgi:predicted nucleic acid-binding protein